MSDEFVDEDKIEGLKQQARAYMDKHRSIFCPALNDYVRINSGGFAHIEWKRQNVKRSLKEIHTRYLCFLNTDWILSNSHTYQEFKEVSEEVEYKVKGKRKKRLEILQYYGFIAIVHKNKNRVKIVVVKNSSGNLSFVSVIPKWKSEEYNGVKVNTLFFEDED